MTKLYYSYDECLEDCKQLVPALKEYNPDAIVSIARGGLLIGQLLSYGLDNRELFSINCVHYDDTIKLDSFKISNIPDLSQCNKIILVDDIIDSGETMVEIVKVLSEKYHQCEIKIASIFYKKSALIQPDFKVREAKEWIEFFWEVDINR